VVSALVGMGEWFECGHVGVILRGPNWQAAKTCAGQCGACGHRTTSKFSPPGRKRTFRRLEERKASKCC
jgi:hypothetical protein